MTAPGCAGQGRPHGPCPHKDGRAGAPFKRPCRGLGQPQELLGGAAEGTDWGGYRLASPDRATRPRRDRKMDASVLGSAPPRGPRASLQARVRGVQAWAWTVAVSHPPLAPGLTRRVAPQPALQGTVLSGWPSLTRPLTPTRRRAQQPGTRELTSSLAPLANASHPAQPLGCARPQGTRWVGTVAEQLPRNRHRRGLRILGPNRPGEQGTLTREGTRPPPAPSSPTALLPKSLPRHHRQSQTGSSHSFLLAHIFSRQIKVQTGFISH